MTPDHDFLGPDDERVRKAYDILLTSIDDTKTRCRSCNAVVVWGRTKRNGRPIMLEGNAVARPLAGAGWAVSSAFVHFGNCPNAAAHRRERRTAPSERID